MKKVPQLKKTSCVGVKPVSDVNVCLGQKFFPEEKVKTNIGFGDGVDIHQMSRSSGQGHKMAFLIIRKTC